MAYGGGFGQNATAGDPGSIQFYFLFDAVRAAFMITHAGRGDVAASADSADVQKAGFLHLGEYRFFGQPTDFRANVALSGLLGVVEVALGKLPALLARAKPMM